MYKTKKDLDAHVRTALSKVGSETERNLRGFTIAKLYYKKNEYATAEQYLCSYLSVKEDSDQAHKMLGQCYQHLKKPDKALKSFQRSLQLNAKQPDVLAEVCKLLLEDKNLNTNQAKYWCELAESEKVQHDAVFSLRLKLMNKDNLEVNQVEEIIQKEIAARPNDVQLRVRLVRNYIEQNKIADAFKYVFNLEMANNDAFSSSSEWYNVVWLVLNKYEQTPNSKSDWDFWLLLITCLERQVFISFAMTAATPTGGATETANLLFNFDQYLYKATQISDKFRVQKDLVNLFLDHYRGQLLLHAASLIFKRELLQNKNKWKETVKSALPLLLMAYQCEANETKEPWMKHCDEQEKQLLQLWNREGAFRCAQAGHTLLSCIVDDTADKENANLQFNKMLGNQTLWTNNDALLAQIRQTCGDKQWRRNVFALLFCNSDHKVKEQTSLIMKSPKLNEPHFDLPTYADVECYEELAQYLKPQSLQHMVYLCIGNNNLSYVRVKYFNVLNFSTQNLSFCGAESLNQLDIETFLYAATLQAKRMLDIDRDAFESYNSENRSAAGKPRILPFVNLQGQLCTEEQSSWWTAAYQVYKNLSSENLAELRANLQFGIEAVRGINGPKIDMMIVFKLGKIFVARAQDVVKPVEKAYLEARAENIFKYGLNMMKMHNKGVLEPFRKYFKYAKSNTSAVERELASAAEDAVSYLATRYFKKAEYEELIDELTGIQLPFATYLQAEAYRKMDEANKTPKKAKRMYLDRASECLTQTLQLLKSTQTDPNHPLNSIIHSELKRVQQASNRFASDGTNYSPITSGGASGGLHNNSSTYEDAESDFFSDNSAALNINRNRREAAAAALIASPRNMELENLVKQLTTTLTFVKEEICEFIKPKILSISSEVATLKDQITSLEDAMKKTRITSNPPSRDDASNVLDDLYMIEDALQNQIYQQSNQAHNLYTSNAAAITGVNTYGHQQQQRIHTPNATMQQMQQNAAAAAVAAAVYNNPMLYAGNSPMNYYTPPQYIMPQGANSGNVLGQRNPLSLPYMDPAGGLNYNLTPTTPLLPPPPTQDPQRAPVNLYGLLTQQNTSTVPQQPQLPPQQQPHQPMPMAIPPQLTTSITAPPSVVPTSLATSAPTSTIQFNKALNNQPVEKGPPANVVITSSDPLPNPNTTPLQAQQQTLSVTIPPHHIKPSLVPAVASNIEVTSSSSTVPFTNLKPTSNIAPTPVFSGFGSSTGPSPFSTTNINKTSPFANNANLVNPVTAVSPSTFSFKPQIAQAAKNADESLNKTNESAASEHNKSVGAGDAEAEYDPRPDFKPIIALPDEIEVKTGEEGEEIMFCHRAKLFRFADKEWKERGIGDIKILKNSDGASRILMRREQTYKICANHKITKELVLTSHKNETKGWIWAAHDFADEELKYEKFLIRFKLPETAKQFGESFKKAQEEAKVNDDGAMPPPVESKVSANKPIQFGLAKSAVTNFATSTPSTKTNETTNLVKPVHVGAISNSTPKTETTNSAAAGSAVSKTLFGFGGTNTTTSTAAPTTNQSSAASPFANFTFGKSTSTTDATTLPVFSSSPFANIFSDLSKSQTSPFNTANLTSGSPAATTEVGRLHKSSISDAEEEYVPTAQFNPVIPLPNLIEVTTGEENELVLFEHRAKLLRFDKEAGEWKERGLGNIKILQDKNDVNKVRLVMRREQIHKLCCNQRIYKDTLFKYAKNSENALTWAGQDFSENELVTEMLTVRFKTPDICKRFHVAMMKAQANMSSEANEDNVKKVDVGGAIKEAGNGVKNVKDSKDIAATGGFGDAFKPKPGSWSCEACYTSNTADKDYCLACDNPKDNTIPKKEPVSILNTGSTPAFTFKFGTNAAATGGGSVSAGDATKAVFGLSSAASSTATPTTAVASSGFGDQFKPKAGSWTCKGCYVSNKADARYCMACDTPKDDTVPKKETETHNILALSDPTKTFTFGFGAAASASTDKTVNAPASGFTFGTPVSTTKSEPPKPTFGGIGNAGNSDTTKTYEFTLPTATSTTLGSSTFSSISKPTFSFSLQSKAMESPAMPTSGGGESTFSFENKEVGLSLKQKSPFGNGGGDADASVDDAEDGEHDHVEEENNTYFTPVIPLPEKIDVKTGEENEETLYVHRAKLYRFIDGEWKERGVGDVKILRHKDTKKLRVVMRRDQVHKICLNHVLNDDINYKRKDEKSWLFVANDFSEGEVELEKFSLRFINKEVAEGFMKAVESALSGTAVGVDLNASNLSTTSIGTTKNDEKQISETDKQLADRLHLPYVFFDTEVSCTGCRGCNSEQFVFPTLKPNESFVNEEDIKNPLLPLELPQLTMPKKNRSLLKQTVFSTPTAEISKETTSKISSNIFSGFGGANSTAFGSGADKSTGANKTFSFGAQQDENKSLFGGGAEGIFGGGGDKKSIFGQSINTTATFNTADKPASIFGASSVSGKAVEGGSIFGGTPVFGGHNLFSGSANNSESIKSIFGSSNLTQSASNGTGNSIFSQSTFSSFGASNKPTTQTSIFGGGGGGGLNATNTNSIFNNSKKDGTQSGAVSTLAAPSFADLSSKAGSVDFASLAAKASTTPTITKPTEKPGPGGFIGLTNTDAFSSFLKPSNNNNSLKNTSTTSDANANDSQNAENSNNDENFDPHFEPIIALPQEIVVSTGEEEETKLFGERATLFRWDDVNKEWKERGVGELKILLHPTHQTYRMILRREQIHKLVLNFGIGAEFTFNNMNNNPKSFVWAGLNYAESATEGILEKLAIRFKKVEIAEQFSAKLKECIDAAKKRKSAAAKTQE